jgi:hypothetical protein
MRTFTCRSTFIYEAALQSTSLVQTTALSHAKPGRTPIRANILEPSAHVIIATDLNGELGGGLEGRGLSILEAHGEPHLQVEAEHNHRQEDAADQAQLPVVRQTQAHRDQDA